jgi:transposase
MRKAMVIQLSEEDREQLERWSRGQTTPQRLKIRADIILHAAAGFQNIDIAEKARMSGNTVAKWRKRFLQGGLSGLENDAPRSGRPPMRSSDEVSEVIHRTLETKPENATQWSTRTLAKEMGVSRMFVCRIWQSRQIKPHLTSGFKLSNGPKFEEKLVDVVGLYLNPPDHAIVLSVDEKSQIQALDRTRKGLPLSPGHCETHTHDYVRHGATTLFAALSMADGRVIGECMPRHRHQEWIRFLERVDRETDPAMDLHLIVDNYATRKHGETKKWLSDHERFHIHFTPTSASWLNMIERWFGELTNQRLRRGAFPSLEALVKAIEDYVAHHNKNPRPFTWTATSDKIKRKIQRAKSIHNKLKN